MPDPASTRPRKRSAGGSRQRRASTCPAPPSRTRSSTAWPPRMPGRVAWRPCRLHQARPREFSHELGLRSRRVHPMFHSRNW